jgi:hypothetical protein
MTPDEKLRRALQNEEARAALRRTYATIAEIIRKRRERQAQESESEEERDAA